MAVSRQFSCEIEGRRETEASVVRAGARDMATQGAEGAARRAPAHPPGPLDHRPRAAADLPAMTL